jgi:ribosome-binding protein aMBF1 (putative translation factor)
MERKIDMPYVQIFEHLITPDIVKGERQKLGLTEAELAAEAQLTESEVKLFEAGKLQDIKIVATLSAALKRRGGTFPKLS